MKKILSFTLAVIALISTNVFADANPVIYVWHSDTVWAGQGQCSANFMFDSGYVNIKKLRATVIARSPDGKQVASGKLNVDSFGDSSANRFATAFFESEAVCAEDLTIYIQDAYAVVNGKLTDLLEKNQLQARKFKPFTIKFERK